MVPLLLVVHVFGVVLFFGGIIASWVWLRQVLTAGDAKIAAFGLNALRQLNKWTLHLGAALVLISGFWMALAAPTPLKLSENPWLLYSVILFFVVVAMAMGMQSPILKRLQVIAEKSDPDFTAMSARIAGRLNMVSLISFVLLLVVLVLMVLKP